MSKTARLFIGTLVILGTILIISTYLDYDGTSSNWTAFAILTLFAVCAQLFKSEAPTHQLYHPTLVFTFAGAMLLQPWLFVIMVLLYHLCEWIKERLTYSPHLRDWYIQPFNISTHLFAGLAAQAIFVGLNSDTASLLTFRAAAAAVIAAISYTLVNHLVIGQVLVLARKIPWKESGILGFENLLTDFIMELMGFNVAVLLSINPWLIFPAVAPFYLIYRALAVPILKQQANTDMKTGLWNAKFFLQALNTELNRSQRHSRPMTVVMADLDLLRNINNTYGHLAGDAVLIGVANILKGNIREYDVVARFGGEEFSIMMPETTPSEALHRVEFIRKSIESTIFLAPTTQAKIKTTMSFGVAGVNDATRTALEIIHSADMAVYQAKLKGRNRSIVFAESCELADLNQEFVNEERRNAVQL